MAQVSDTATENRTDYLPDPVIDPVIDPVTDTATDNSYQPGISIPLLAIAGLYLLLQIIVNGLLGGYGIFRDEFYYLVNAERLAWGYVDHPPLAPFLLAGLRATLGDSTVALRLLPALAGAGTVYLTGMIARRMGGRQSAQMLAALAVIAVPVYAVMFGFYSMNALEIFLWTAALYVLTGLLAQDRGSHWLIFGLLTGVALQNKHTVLLFAAGLVLGLLLHRRRAFRGRWLWLGGLLAFVLFLPNLIWQFQNDWPTVEFYAGAVGKNIDRTPVDILLDQLLTVNPVLIVLWLPGLFWLLRTRSFRPLAWTYLLPLLVLMATGSSRPDRLAPAYVLLLAGGAVALERWARHSGWRWMPVAAIGLVLIGAVTVAPLGLPLLSPPATARYAAFFGLGAYEAGVTAELPQYFADRFGWQALTATVAQVYDDLPQDEQAQVAIFTSNYGEAAAIHYYGRAYDLPSPVSGHNNYWLWGPGDASGEILITVNIPKAVLESSYNSVELAAMTACEYCVDYENQAPILVARGLKSPLAEVWSALKHYE